VEDIRRLIKTGARIDSQRGVRIGGMGGWRKRGWEEGKKEGKKERREGGGGGKQSGVGEGLIIVI